MTTAIPGWGAPAPGDPSTWPPIITRSYHGKPQEAARLMAAEAAQLAAHGYAPISQSYTQGSWGCGAFAIAILLILAVGLGLLILAYLVIVKPAGDLVVTYQRQAVPAPAQPESPAFQRFPTGG